MGNRALRLREAVDANAAPAPDAVAQAVDALLQSGDRAGAIAAYRDFELRFPTLAANSGRLREAYERALWAQPASLPTNLPAPRNRFVGRHAELARVAEHALNARFVCLTGPGGIGKSRIALQTGRMWLSRYEDGVWWIDCSSVATEDALLGAIARTVRFEDHTYSEASLIERIGSQRLMLVLDCCESFTSTIAAFASSLVVSCPNVMVLATSRKALAGAQIVNVSALPLPQPGAIRASDAAKSDAIRLFVETAIGADPDFVLNDRNAPLVAQLCQALDGVPQAIEIAAAHLAHTDVSEVHERLTGRTLSDFDRTVARTIEWAYDSLNENDAALLRCLSIFPTTWTAHDAIAMDGSRDALDRLLKASLIVSEKAPGGSTHYRMLDTTRNLMRARLRECGESESAAERFVRHIVDVAHTYRESLERADGKAPLQLRDRYDSIAHVIDMGAADRHWTKSAVEIAATIGIGLGMLGFASDLATRVRSVIHKARGTDVEAQLIFDRALASGAWLSNRRGDYHQAIKMNDDLIARARARSDPQSLGRSLALAVGIYCNAGRFDRALELAHEGIGIARPQGDVRGLSIALRGLAYVLLQVGRGAEALKPMEEFLQLPPDDISKMQQAMGLAAYAQALHAAGRLQESRMWWERSASLAGKIHDRTTQAYAHANLARVLGETNDPRAAHREALEAVGLCEDNVSAIVRAVAFEEYIVSALREDQLLQLAFLLGYVDEVRRRHAVVVPPERIARNKSIRDVLSQRIPGAEFNRALRAGAESSLHQAIEMAAGLHSGQDSLAQTDRLASLTRREREVAQLAAAGLTNRAIAEKLELSVRTIDVHIASIFRKLRIDRRDRIL